MGQHKVCVGGLWHLGSVTAACLADLGFSVTGFDPSAERVSGLAAGKAPIYEPGLDELLQRNLRAGNLAFTSDLANGVRGASHVIIAFDTPVNESDDVDLREILDTVRRMAPLLDDGATLVVSSQAPVGTCQRLAESLAAKAPEKTFRVACVPENLRLGQAMQRFLHPDFLVIGAEDSATHESVERLFTGIDTPKVRVSLKTAEMCKHAINTYLATMISFGNEIANLCDLVGADAPQVARVLRMDARVSPRAPLEPGMGFAGGTLARDVKALRRLGAQHGYTPSLIAGVAAVNQRQNRMVVRRLQALYPSLQQLNIGVLGLTYKPGTSTLRRSAALEIIGALSSEGAQVRAYDPKADPAELKSRNGTFRLCDDPYEAAAGCDALLLATPWPQFKELDYARVRAEMRQAVLLDPHNLLNPDALANLGFVYQGTGIARMQGGNA